MKLDLLISQNAFQAGVKLKSMTQTAIGIFQNPIHIEKYDAEQALYQIGKLEHMTQNTIKMWREILEPIAEKDFKHYRAVIFVDNSLKMTGVMTKDELELRKTSSNVVYSTGFNDYMEASTFTLKSVDLSQLTL